jgi:hypothetical protein
MTMVTLHLNAVAPEGGEDARKSSAASFARVSWVLLALALVSTTAVVAGQLVAPLVLDDPSSQQQSVDATYIANGVVLALIYIAVAVGYERLSAIAREQVRFHRDLFAHSANRDDAFNAMDDLARRTRRLALILLLYSPTVLIYLAVVGSVTETRQAARLPAVALPCAHPRGSRRYWMMHAMQAVTVVMTLLTSSIQGGKWYPSNFLIRTCVLRQNLQAIPIASSPPRSNDSSSARAHPSELKVRPHSVDTSDAKTPTDTEFSSANEQGGMPTAHPGSMLSSSFVEDPVHP